ncbi:hypothetical protein [Aureispira sp. CCB-QB1]|uniref:hypothetical protein n=1 Tax=Aureispira sp. CCB-QB1 TaxID=1313421 RepID=UPI0006972BF9|nr:hypothetical protein [Aureispira sp. CCB-QB1]
MNKYKIIAIYQEMLASIHKIKNSGHTLSEGEAIQLAQLETITTQLKQKADAAGFGEEMVADYTVPVNSADDLFQLIDTSACSADIRQALTDVVAKNYVADGLSRKKLWDVLQVFDKYYVANVDNVSAVTVNSRMQGEWEKIFGKGKYDLNLLATAYQNSAKEALLKEIKVLSANGWSTKANNLHVSFDKIFKGKKSWLDSANDIKTAPSQLKIDVYEFPLIPDHFNGKYVNFTGGKGQISGKLALIDPITITNQEKFLNGFIVDFEQVLKSSINLKMLRSKMPSMGAGSTTLFSKGLTLDLGFVLLTLKTDVAKYSFTPGLSESDVTIDENGNEKKTGTVQKIKNRSKFNPISIRFQGAINCVKLMDSLGSDFNFPGVDFAACNISISIGFNVTINPPKAKPKVDGKKTSPTPDDVDKPSLEKDNKRLRQIQEKNKDLVKKADQLADAVDKKDLDRLKKAAGEFQNTAQEAYELLEDHNWKDKSIKNKAADLLNETAEKVYKKVAGPVSKLTKALKYAKPLARLMPGVNAILTVIEVGTFIYDFVVWFNSIDANTWEDYFIAFGSSMEKSTFGQWFKRFDRYMKS